VTGAAPGPPPGAAVRFDWGLAGTLAASESGGAIVIVDVLSFSTAVTIATGRGAVIYPHRWPAPADSIEAFAAARHAAWAVPRHQTSASHPWSLSPAGLLGAPLPDRLVLPSPNGSGLAAAATGSVTAGRVTAGRVTAGRVTAGRVTAGRVTAGRVIAGCLRNATAVARWLEWRGYGTPDQPVTVIAAGEHWPSGELRPALEDFLGAGAIIAALPANSIRSPEAASAEAAWHSCHHQVREFLHGCFSGLELAADGYAADIALAAEHDAQDAVPLLTDTAFQDDTSHPERA
jgi:2-phosphosulfolactate phosphatase